MNAREVTSRQLLREKLEADTKKFLRKKGNKITKVDRGETGYVSTKHIVINRDKYYSQRRSFNKMTESERMASKVNGQSEDNQ